MPAPLDLTGRRFGRLTVLSRGDRIKWGKWQSSWLCRCDCGAIIAVPQNRLPHRDSIPASHRIDACDDCRAKACLICGGPIPASSSASTCSPDCHTARRRQIDLEHYYRSRRDDPACVEANRERKRALRAALTPEERRDEAGRKASWAREHREELNAQARVRHAERMLDPEYAERVAEIRRVWVERNPERAAKYSRDHRRRMRAARAARDLGETADLMGEDQNDE